MRPRSRAVCRLLPLLAVAGLLAAAPPAAAQSDRGAYTIRSFDTDLVVEPNSDLLVEERIEVVFTEPRHGIFRTIPVRYSDPRGFAYSLDLRLVDVGDGAGGRHEAVVSNEGRYVKIRIGDPDREVVGAVTYVVRYRVRDALGRFAEHDEIYWNATGHEWAAPIARSATTVHLPGPVDAGQIRAAGYTGRFGEQGRDVAITVPSPGVVRFTTTRGLAPLEGLTVAVGFPQGIVQFPTPAVRAARAAADNWVALLPLGWLAFLIARYRQGGRDPDSDDTVTVTYEPPPGLSPGCVGTLVDERVDTVDITASVVDLAVRGYLTIRMEHEARLFGLFTREETVFARGAEGRGPLLPHERLILSGLFASGDEVKASALANKFYRHIPDIQRALYARLADEGYFAGSPQATRTRWRAWGVAAGVVTGLAAGGWMQMRGIGEPASIVVPLLTGAVTIVAFLAFAPAMPRRTAKGVAARRWARGFQEFVTRTDADRLAQSVADPQTAFEALLPHAMALGVARAWATKFEGIYRDREPTWYSGPHGAGGFSTTSFERSLSDAMTSTSRSMTASPRSSSGSGGGGSSGGGGGGGGGGSW